MTVTEVSPEQFMGAAPAMPGGNSPWAQRMASDIRGVVTRAAARAPRSTQVHLGPSELGTPCLAGDTEIVTRQGIKKIRDVAEEGRAELLVPLLYEGSDVRKKWGRFTAAPVTSFGEQELFEITLRRSQETKTVLATANHRWFRSYWSGKQKKQQCLETQDLKPGHKLTQLRRAMPRYTTPMHWAVAQGFVFGDGTRGTRDDRHRPARLSLYHNGKDEAMLRFFPGDWAVRQAAGHAHKYSAVTGLPRFWKELPPIDESVSFLMSWLAGYFAADGCVTEDGHCSVSSAYREHLEFVRDVAAVCGIGYGQVQRHLRQGGPLIRNQDKTPLYRLSLRRRDLPDWFFLTSVHAARAAEASKAPERDPHWLVESVTSTGRKEPVYCATVSGTGAFALADDLMTGNCDRQVVGKFAGAPRTNHVSDPWPSVVGTAVHAWLAKAFEDDNARTGVLRWVTETRVVPHPLYPGTADLYDAAERAVVDHKVLGATSLAKIRSGRPPRKYVVQLLLYAAGYRNFGLPVDHVAIAAYPRTASTLDGLYVWDRACGPGDLPLVSEVLARTEFRRALGAEVAAGRMTLEQVPAAPDDSECFFCAFYRPQAARDGGPGCPGTLS